MHTEMPDRPSGLFLSERRLRPSSEKGDFVDGGEQQFMGDASEKVVFV